MTLVYLLLYIAACVCFALAVPARSATQDRVRVNLIALGLLFFAAVPTLQVLIGVD